MTVSDLLVRPCNKSDNINKFNCYNFLQVVLYTCLDNLEQAVRTQLVGGLLQDAYIGDRINGLNLYLFESA